MKYQSRLETIEEQCLTWLNENGYEIKKYSFVSKPNFESVITLEFENIVCTFYFNIAQVFDFHYIISDEFFNQMYWHCSKILTRDISGYSNTTESPSKSGHLPILLKHYYK
jgi:hypothetical protein